MEENTIQQISNIVNTVTTEGLHSFKQAVENNGECAAARIETCEKNIESLRKIIDNPDTNIEERLSAFKMIESQQDKQEAIHQELKDYDAEILGKVMVFGGIMLTIAVSLSDPKNAKNYFRYAVNLLPKAKKHLKPAA